MSHSQHSEVELSPLKRAFLALEELQNKLDAVQAAANEPIAVIGLGCRFPGGANTPAALWELLHSGAETVIEAPRARGEMVAGIENARASFLQEPVDGFDPQFFGIAPREAHGMDPQQRLLLEVAWEALEYACQAPDKLEGTRTGVYMGVSASDYMHLYVKREDPTLFDGYYASGVAHSIASGRLSYLLGLQGPSVSVDTACSSSLAAVHLAVQSLRSGETDMALAGGVNLMLAPENFLAFSRFGMLAPDGRCKTFDAAADGFGRGEGCGVVVLKRLSDALANGDRVLAQIRGSAMNQDGASSGLTAPNGPAQEAVIRAALAQAGIDPCLVSYVETHGTGTALGDPIEVQALGNVFGPNRTPGQPLLLGAVKACLGHTEAAAGVAGLIKVVLALQSRELPPQPNFHTPSPHIPWARLPFNVPTRPVAWEGVDGRCIAGVSAFGFSGTNVHMLVETAPEIAPKGAPAAAAVERPLHVLALAAKNSQALAELADRMGNYLAGHRDQAVGDVCFSANSGRTHFHQRLTIVADSVQVLEQNLHAFAAGRVSPDLAGGVVQRTGKPKIAFLFTGQGSQYAGMGHQLYATQPTFRAALDRCAAILRRHLDTPLLDLLDPAQTATGLLDNTTYTQPALFAVEYALAELWRSWGVEPNYVMGHSVGEYVAATVAGVFSLEDALKLIVARGRLMGALPAGGTMAAVFADEARVAAAVKPYGGSVAIAAVNGPDNVVISGRQQDVDAIVAGLAVEGIKARPLKVSHAFHSPLMDPMLDDFARIASEVVYAAPRLRLVSDVTGQLAPGDMVAKAAYWREHCREPVRFAAAIATLHQQGVEIFLEIGPGSTLSGMGERCLAHVEQEPLWLPSIKPPRSEWTSLLDSLAALYRAGVTVDWTGFDRDYVRQRLALPPYPFQRQRYWLPPHRETAQRATIAGDAVHPLLGRRLRSALSSVQFEAALRCDAFSYLNDHRLQGAALLPGAALMEAALAAGRKVLGSDNVAVQELLLLDALFVSDGDERIVQWIVTPQEAGDCLFECYSRAPGDDAWRLHARGRLVLANESAPPAAELSALQAACPSQVAAEEHYANLQSNGLDFGPSLHGVVEVWRRDSEALGRIECTESVAAETQDYLLHPALLDAHIQVIAAAMPQRAGVYLPFSLDRYQLYRPALQPVWSHVRLQLSPEVDGDVMHADVRLLDAQGEVVADLEGLHLKRVDRRLQAGTSGSEYDSWLYEVQWEKQPDAGREPAQAELSATQWPAFHALAGDLARELEKLEDQHHLADYALDVAPQLDRLSLAYIVNALHKLGWQPTPGSSFTPDELRRELGIAPRHTRLLRRFCAVLAEAELVQPGDEAWDVCAPLAVEDTAALEALMRRQYPAYTAEVDLVARCGGQLAEALSGRIDPVHLLFPQGDLSTAEALYTKSPSARVYNGLLRSAVERLLAQRPAGPLRVLEIGGGTGGTTAYLLPMVPAEQTSYLFTDISPLFVARAQEKFEQYAFVRFAALDLEQDPAAQGLGEQQFDLIVAANVVHATADLRQSLGHIRRLLAPDGMLVMLEVTGPQRWVDVTFGLTDGWWRFSDAALRPTYPLLTIAQWKELLVTSGFDTVVATPEEDGAGFVDQAVILAHQPAQTGAAAGRWLLLADQGGTGERLAQLLSAQGGECITAVVGTAYAPGPGGVYTLDPLQPQDFRHLLDDVGTLPLRGVIHLWSLDAPSEDVDGVVLAEAQSTANASVLHLVQALAAKPTQAAPRLWLVTRGAQSVAAGDELPAVVQSPLWGLSLVAALEHPELQPVALDLDSAGEKDASALLAELLGGGAEDRVALRGGQRYVARLAHSRLPASLGQANDEPYSQRIVRLEPGQRGTLQHLAWQPAARPAPAAGEVEIRVHATGLNFKDVLNTLGMYPGDAGPLGGECAGEVVAVGAGVTGVQVGERVAAIAPGAFSSYVVAQAELVAPLPEGMSYAAGASIPIAFVTAAYTLLHLGKLQAGERVLIHAAAGGVGLAAVQLAQRAGAEVYATAGSEAKRSYLRSLGVEHVLDSRTLAFAEQVRALSGGRGMDVVLNSLAGDFVAASLSVLAPGGRFLEIGKSGLLTPAQAAALGHNRQYFAVDWTPDASENPQLIRSLLDEVMTAIDTGDLALLPYRQFAQEEVQTAFRYMAQARHTGKIVVMHDVMPDQGVRPGHIRAGVTYLVTGGLRGLGLLVARWLAEQGATSLALVGRSAPGAAERAQIEALEGAGCRVLVMQADVSLRSDVERVLAAIDAQLPPLAGIIHSAGVLDDGVLVQQTWPRFAAVLAPKVLGAWHLHQLTQQKTLDFFVLFSSIASLLGSPGQGNHAAANAFLDALAHHRRRQGLPAISINWGIWSEVGIAAERAIDMQRGEQGLLPIAPKDGLCLLARILEQQPTQIGVSPVAWPQFLRRFEGGRRPFFHAMTGGNNPAIPAPIQRAEEEQGLLVELAALPAAKRRYRLIDFVKIQACRVLDLDPTACDERLPLRELGLDSLMAVELRNVIGQQMGLKRSLPATLVFDYPSVQAISDFLLRSVLVFEGQQANAEPVAPAGEAANDFVLDIEALSDEEVERRLAQQFS